MIEQRPDPDQLLRQVQSEEKEATSAKLKIFLGPYPGVGKTFSMLEAARERKREGLDVVVGVVETHGRPETAALLHDQEILARKEITYRGITIKEFDLDEALIRKPDLIVVDELAHTNGPGSRHARRWQDVEELLNAGISVYTTLNVQHWESLNDVISQITGVRVRETVPDSFLQKAHEVELVDLPPDDLLKRMSEGKVYVGDQALRAAENFFRVGNLIALRELALRFTAERVDAQMQEFKNRYAISKVLPVRERLLVGITASPRSARLIRATLRLATSLRCDWIAVYVQTPEHQKLPPDQQARIIDTLRLAERLGGETVILTGQDVPAEVLKFARQRNVTKIVLGKPSEPRWREFLFGSTVNQIARHSGEIDLYVISAIDISDEPSRSYPVEEKQEREGFWQATLILICCTILGRLLLESLDRTNIIMLYLLGIVWITYRYGRIAGIYGSILSVLLFDFFLVPPHLTFAVRDTQYLITFGVMLLVSIFISTLTGRLLLFAQTIRARESRLRSLHRVSRTLSETSDQSEMLNIVSTEIQEFLQLSCLILLPDTAGSLHVRSGDAIRFGFSGNEIQTAEWVFRRIEIAGHGTDTLAGSKGTYFPMCGREKTLGVLGVRFREEARLVDPEQLQLLETVASEIGQALESRELSEAAGRARASMESERLKNLVLRSFSYDLAGPAQEILSASQGIQEHMNSLNADFKKAISTIADKAEQINRVVARLPDFVQETFPSIPETSAKPQKASLAQGVALTEVLSPDRILFFPSGAGKAQILRELVNSLRLPDSKSVLQSIEEREAIGGILIRPNVAIPHTTVENLNGVIASLGIQRTQNGKGEDTHFWLLFVSGDESTREHLLFLRSVAETFTENTMEELSTAKSPQQAYSVLQKSA